MQDLIIPQEGFSPKVSFLASKGLLEISGNSYQEGTPEFYEPIFQWLDTYLDQPGKELQFNFRMSYFNTSSSKCFYKIIEKLKNYDASDKGKVEVNWYYKDDDEDMYETGMDYLNDSAWKKLNLISYK
ncbi:DUF1987 domain-containing protein [Sediminitomix flava]|uniref:Uncharacterized protein DUF1987 n=1 Tax=Sediminitomix flava TaxID=379075 RepID=A0A315Z9X4_SEDFL|nr:DUF1987 domain-containing protein [Sediminitomix flava]PWJ41863.1 uncharacterized protein DUF1987 [Sediminitomix flava]